MEHQETSTNTDQRETGLAGAAGSGSPVLVGFDRSRRTLTIRMPEDITGYMLGAEILIGEPGWTVQASDYDKLAEAARWLRRACKDRLPPGHYDKVSGECRAVDAILCPNVADVGRAGDD